VTVGTTPRDALRDRVELVEASYDFFLAYAAQGLTGEGPGAMGSELRQRLERLEDAVAELAPLLGEVVRAEGLKPAERFEAFREVLAEDARKAGAALRLVAARPSISSQMVDNLNASIHLRALLTDLFLLDEVLALEVPEG
jgi:hypothetical protein